MTQAKVKIAVLRMRSGALFADRGVSETPVFICNLPFFKL